jgi:PAS domain S-box-containing protein
MKGAETRPPADASDEIAALIETLHDTEQRLEALTAGEVDTVANRCGRTLLLRRAQQGLRRSDAEKQAAILNALPAHVALLDGAGTIVSVNDAWRRFAHAEGEPDEEGAVGLHYLDARGVGVRTPSEALEVAAGVQAVLRGELRQYSMEYACHKPGEQRWFLMTVTPLAGEWQGGAIVMHLDVTERTLAAQSSRQSAALLQAVADGTPDQVYVKDLEGRYLLCNRAVAQYMGVSIEELLGSDNSRLLAEGDRAAPLASDRRVLGSGRSDTSEYSLTRGGQRRTFHTTKAPYRNEAGELIGLFGISRDITDRLQSETARDNERLMLRTLIDTLPEVVYTKDLTGRYVICNRAALTQFGLTQEHELAGKTAFDVLPPEAAELAQADDGRVLAGDVVMNRVDQGTGAAGLPEWSSVVKVPLRDAAGQVMGLVGFRRDISEQQRARQDLVDRKAVLLMVGRIAKVGGWSLDLLAWRHSGPRIEPGWHEDAPDHSPLLDQSVDSFAPEHRDMVRRAMERCATDGTTYELEAEKVAQDGRRFWVRTMGEAVRDGEGRIHRIQGASQDITERKLGELATRKLAERLSNTLESITDSFFTVDRDWRFTHVNSQAERLMRRHRAELIGHVLWDVFPAALGTPFEQGYRRAMAGEMGVAFEAMYAPWAQWIGINCYPSEDGLSVYFRDVSAQRASRRRLEMLEASVSQLNDVVLIAVAGRDGEPAVRIEFVNDAFVRATGHARADVLGKSPKLLCGPRTDRSEIERLRGAGERREPVHSELQVYRKDGQAYWIEVDMVPIVMHAEEHSHWVVVGRDITERRRDQQALRELNAELEGRVSARTAELDMARDLAEQANRAKSSFLATMSHEIRTPMNGVIGMIDVLEQTSLRPSQLEIVRTARESAYALLGIVDDVLDFSKIEAGQFQIDREPMNVTSVVEGMCDALDHLAASKGVALGLFVDPRLPERIMGDAARLRQVLMNLVGNAIKFSSGPGRAGRVAVRALPDRSGPQPALLEISVVDNGIGMDDATLERLFVPFTQADAGTTRRFGGTGLGLSISHRLVEMMGGSIAVRSVAGQGTTFTVQLPLWPAPTPTADAAPDRWPGLQHQRCLVLGASGGPADDLAVYLECVGAQVQRPADLHTAAALLAQGPPGSCVAVLADASDPLEAMLAACREAGRAQQGLTLRFVVIEHGRRRKPRVKAPDLVSLDGESLHRGAFLRAVALASGSISLPEAQDTSLDTSPVPLGALEAGAAGRPILVAEDNEINQKVLRRQLALLGFQADIAGNGREALERWRGADYALLITDLHMPSMDGYELAAAIRAEEAGERHMPIVALTANAVKGEARRCLEIGMDDYMTKPVQLSALKTLLLRWLTPAVAVPDAFEARSAGSAGDRQTRGETAPADLKVLAALIGDDAGEIAEVLALFQTISEQLRNQIRQGVASGSLRVVADAAHTLKSNARAIGALVFGQTCEDIEQEAEAANADGLREMIARFEAELASLREYLRSVDPAAGEAGVQGLRR